jgi:hypothetical protein
MSSGAFLAARVARKKERSFLFFPASFPKGVIYHLIDFLGLTYLIIRCRFMLHRQFLIPRQIQHSSRNLENRIGKERENMSPTITDQHELSMFIDAAFGYREEVSGNDDSDKGKKIS